MQRITIIIPCLNEERYIAQCLEAVSKFQLPSDSEVEVLVLDGMSTDSTRTIVKSYSQRDSRISLVDNPKRIQSAALNLAIITARGEWILRLDAHTYYPDDYLKQCILTARRVEAANIGGVCETRPGGPAYGAEVVQALTTHRFGVGNSPFRTPRLEGPADTVPFGFFRRSIFAEVGLFDERLERNEDFEFNARLRKAKHIVWLTPNVRCFYHNQPTLQAFLKKQLCREAPYNVYLWYVAPYAFAVRHGITCLFVGWILGGGLFSLLWQPAASIVLATLLLYLSLSVAAAIQQAIRYRRLRHMFALPLAFLAFHSIHGIGMWYGVLKLLFRRAPVQDVKEPWPGAYTFQGRGH